MKSFEQLKRDVIDRGLCTTCGTCVGLCPWRVLGITEEDGELLPELKGECKACGICTQACPGADIPIPVLEQKFFGRVRPERKDDLGVYAGCYYGYASDPTIREKGTGGGLVSALLAFSLERGVIDCALVAGFQQDNPLRTEARLVTTKEEVLAAAGSKYAVVPINSLLNEAVARGYTRIAIVGCPCHIHGIRKMQFSGKPDSIAKAVKLVIGLFCASQFYFEGTRHLLVEQGGIKDLKYVKCLNYRGGNWPGHLTVRLADGKEIVIDRHHYMYHILMPAYKRDRCEMCTDWAAELADVAVGDYWDPTMKPGTEAGKSTILVRSSAGEELVGLARTQGAISLELLEPKKVTAGIGFELKKHAAAFRLKQRRRFGWPVPNYHRETDYTPFLRETHLAPSTRSE
ncbi:coenzyme F420 hydrogenase subunit beta [Carboxydocella thermautotrophica]|nr:coenzyme F420 hydrogenase subunit beta [Carboxydocella thermautotrophica]